MLLGGGGTESVRVGASGDDHCRVGITFLYALIVHDVLREVLTIIHKARRGVRHLNHHGQLGYRISALTLVRTVRRDL